MIPRADNVQMRCENLEWKSDHSKSEMDIIQNDMQEIVDCLENKWQEE